MEQGTVIVSCDVYVSWSGAAPTYRLYVGDELFTERTWIWTHQYLHEVFAVTAPYGSYSINYQLLPHPNAAIKIKNLTVDSGPGRIRKHSRLEIHDGQ